MHKLLISTEVLTGLKPEANAPTLNNRTHSRHVARHGGSGRKLDKLCEEAPPGDTCEGGVS